MERTVREVASLLALAPVSVPVAIIDGKLSEAEGEEVLAESARTIAGLVADSAIKSCTEREIPEKGILNYVVEYARTAPGSAMLTVASSIGDHVGEARDPKYSSAINKALWETSIHVGRLATAAVTAWAEARSASAPKRRWRKR